MVRRSNIQLQDVRRLRAGSWRSLFGSLLPFVSKSRSRPDRSPPTALSIPFKPQAEPSLPNAMQANQTTQPMPFQQRMELMHALLLHLAIPCLALLRHRVGARLLSFPRLIVTTGLLWLAAEFAGRTQNSQALQIFALCALLAGIAQRFRRWLEYRNGVSTHSFYLGDSLFSFYLPEWLRRERRFTAWFDPLLLVAVGAGLFEVSPATSVYLILSGFGLRAIEQMSARAWRERELDLCDSQLVALASVETVENFSHAPAHVMQASQPIPTALSPDLARIVAQHKTQNPER
jgi:hypothetical protein